MKEEWFLSLPKAEKLKALDDALKEGRLWDFIILSKLLLNAPLRSGGIATEEIEKIVDKHF